MLDRETGPQLQREIPFELLLHLEGEVINAHEQDHVEASGDDLVPFRRRHAIQTVPSASGVVATFVANAIAEAPLTESLVVRVAFGLCVFAVIAVEQALLCIARQIAVVVLEDFPAVLSSRGRITSLPRICSKSAVSSVIVASVSVALFVTDVVAGLGVTQVFFAGPLLGVDVDDVLTVGLVDSSGRRLVEDIAVFASPFPLARTNIVTDFVDALSVLAGIVVAFVPRVLFAVLPGGAQGTLAGVVRSVVLTSAAVLTRRAVANSTGVFAVLSVVSRRANANMPTFTVGTNTAVLAGIVLTKVSLGLTVATHPARLAVALIVVDQLDAVLGSEDRTRIGQAFIDVAFASGSDEARLALTFVPADFVDTAAAVMTSPFEALIDIDLAEETHGAVRAGTLEVVDQIMANTVVLAGIGIAVIDVVLAVLALESDGTLTTVGADEIFAAAPVLARVRVAFVDLVLAVAPVVSVRANALVAVAEVATVSSILAEIFNCYSPLPGSDRARDLLDVADLSGPSVQTFALKAGSSLFASGSVFTRRFPTPVDHFLAVSSGPSDGTTA